MVGSRGMPPAPSRSRTLLWPAFVAQARLSPVASTSLAAGKCRRWWLCRVSEFCMAGSE